MAQEVHTVRSDMQLQDVIKLMQLYRHGGYPVLDPDERLVGMITLRDIRQVPLEGRLSTPVSAAMTTALNVLTPDQTLADAATLMARHAVGRLPVVDPADRSHLVGILSRSDVLRSYPAELAPEEAFLER
jgi:CIC family chloride channel protein